MLNSGTQSFSIFLLVRDKRASFPVRLSSELSECEKTNENLKQNNLIGLIEWMQKPQPNSPLNYVVFRRAENATVSNVTMRGRIFQSTPLISSPAKFYFFYAMINKVSRLGFLFPNHRPKSNTIQRWILFEALTVPKKDHRCKKSSKHL